MPPRQQFILKKLLNRGERRGRKEIQGVSVTSTHTQMVARHALLRSCFSSAFSAVNRRF